jgi:hypothetical protein
VKGTSLDEAPGRRDWSFRLQSPERYGNPPHRVPGAATPATCRPGLNEGSRGRNTMSTIERGTMKRAAVATPLTGAEMMRAVRDDGRRLITRLMWGALALTILVGVGLLAGGCGQQSEDRAASTPQSDQAVAASQGAAGPVVARAAGLQANGPAAGSPAPVAADSLPPDVAASVADGLVLAGTAVEITAEGSPDVVSVTLGDPTGGKHPFAFEASTGLWRAAYRVPVRSAGSRLSLSVTAHNASGRWRRVWTSFDVAGRGEEASAAVDSTSTVKP